MRPGERFEKSWTIRNATNVPWQGRTLRRLGIAADPGLITTPDHILVPDTEPGETVTIAVPFVAHRVEGTSRAVFKMADTEGRLYFPDRHNIGLQVQVTVIKHPRPRDANASPSPNRLPTAQETRPALHP